jgi:hypothetical protein
MKLLDMDCKPELRNKNEWSVLTYIFVENNFKFNDIILEKLLDCIDNKFIKDRHNRNIFFFAAKYSNNRLLNFAIDNLCSGYKDNFTEYYSCHNIYPIDYLVKRIYDYDKINNYGKIYFNYEMIKFNFDKENIEIDIYYLLHMLSKINYNYEDYCSVNSKEFIEQVLIVKSAKQNVFDELLIIPPIDGFFCGGYEYYKSMMKFESLAGKFTKK